MILDKECTFQSFEPFLKNILLLIKPKSVLEFGPGTSTRLLINYTDAKIISIETEKKWFKQYKYIYKNEKRVNIYYKKQNWNLTELNDLIKNEIDFSFVDAGNRIEELWFLKKILAQEGLVFLHDAHRNDYYWGITRYKFCFFIERHSCLLTDSKEIYKEMLEKINPDYSNVSKYSSPEYRQEYFKQFISKNKGNMD